MKRPNILAATYTHPEGLGPYISSALMLSRLFGGVTILHRNVLETAWPFPANVSLVSVGTYLHIRESERKPASWKAAMFVRYAWEMLRQLRRGRHEVVLLYDPIPLLAYRLVAPLLGYTPKVWYHNWDIIEASRVRKFSITWFAAKSEAGMMAQVDLFSLPIDERKPYFAMARLKGRYLLIPNYPVQDFYGRIFAQDRRPPGELRLLYSGSIAPGHGLEEIIRLLPRTLCGRRLKLVLKGHLRPEFEATLRHLAHEHSVGEQVEVVPAGAYQGVFSVLERCDVGIAIYTGQDLMNRTMSIGPSKVYEYIAAGMPVLFFEPHWRQAFSSHSWAIPTDLSEESLGRQLEFIIRDYLSLARAAAADFRAHLHCDGFYQKAAAILLREDGATAV